MSTTKKVDEIVSLVGKTFRTFGGGQTSGFNPIVNALSDKPYQFAAGVDVRDVVIFVAPLLEDNNVKYRLMADLISRIFFYGDFKAETNNERKLEKLLIEVGLWPTTEQEIIERPEI